MDPATIALVEIIKSVGIPGAVLVVGWWLVRQLIQQGLIVIQKWLEDNKTDVARAASRLESIETVHRSERTEWNQVMLGIIRNNKEEMKILCDNQNAQTNLLIQMAEQIKAIEGNLMSHREEVARAVTGLPERLNAIQKAVER